MTKEEYAQERKDPRWQKKRLEIMERDCFKCRDCSDDKATLNVHHSYYVKGRKCWNYPSFSLETLCWKCHEQRHKEVIMAGDGIGGFSEMVSWEYELDCLMERDPSGGSFCFLASEIQRALQNFSQVDLFKKIEAFIASLREKSEGAE